MLLLALACAPDAPSDSAVAPIDLPGHNECLPDGEVMGEEVCLAVVEADGRYPGVSENKSGLEPVADDPRLADPEFQWLTAEVKRCACACCHTARWNGPGVYFWDLDFAPVWVDSASVWSLEVFGGWTEEDAQTLPTEELDRVRVWLEGEIDRRHAAD